MEARRVQDVDDLGIGVVLEQTVDLGDHGGICICRLLRSAVPGDVRFHENDVGAGDETAHATQFFDGVAGQLCGIVSLDDGHLGQCRIGCDGVTALDIDCQGGLGPKAVFAEPESQAGSARRNST